MRWLSPQGALRSTAPAGGWTGRAVPPAERVNALCIMSGAMLWNIMTLGRAVSAMLDPTWPTRLAARLKTKTHEAGPANWRKRVWNWYGHRTHIKTHETKHLPQPFIFQYLNISAYLRLRIWWERKMLHLCLSVCFWKEARLRVKQVKPLTHDPVTNTLWSALYNTL